MSEQRHEWAEEPLGSTAEELARLMEVIGDWAKGLTGDIAEHVDTGAPECTYCPVCRTVHVLRESSPEVKVHLAGAAASLMQAAASVLNAATAGAHEETGKSPGEGEEAHGVDVRAEDGTRRTEKVEHIDLDGWS